MAKEVSEGYLLQRLNRKEEGKVYHEKETKKRKLSFPFKLKRWTRRNGWTFFRSEVAFSLSLSFISQFFLPWRRTRNERVRKREKWRRKECFKKLFKGTIFEENKRFCEQNSSAIFWRKNSIRWKRGECACDQVLNEGMYKHFGSYLWESLLVLLISRLSSISSYWWLCF